MSKTTNFLNSTLPDFPEDENSQEYQYLAQKYGQDKNLVSQDKDSSVNTDSLLQQINDTEEDFFSIQKKESNQDIVLDDIDKKTQNINTIATNGQNSFSNLRQDTIPVNQYFQSKANKTSLIHNDLPLVHKTQPQNIEKQKDYLPTLNSTWIPSKQDIASSPQADSKTSESSTLSIAPSNKNKQHKNTIFGKIFLILFLLIAISLSIVITPAVVSGVRIAFAAQDIKVNFDQIKKSFKDVDFIKVQQSTRYIDSDLKTIHNSLQNIGLIERLPLLDSKITALKDTVRVSQQAIKSANELIDVSISIKEALSDQSNTGQPFNFKNNHTYSSLSSRQKRNVLKAVQDSLPKLRLARDKLEIAITLWNSVDQESLPESILNPLKTTIPYFSILKNSLDQAIPMIEVFIPLLGYPDTQYYLILNQNADEIRPSGGFIGTVVDMKISNGDFSKYEFTDVYNVDDPIEKKWNVKPPMPITKYFGLPKFFMRDANWSPDFGVSAEKVMSYYEQEKALDDKPVIPRTVGVALEPSFFKNLLSYTGPFKVEDSILNKDNFMDILQYNVEIKPWKSKDQEVEYKRVRKNFMKHVGDALFEKIQNMPKESWPELLNVITKSLNEKQILIYSRQPELEDKINKLNWGGRVKNTKGDYMFVVDANLGGRKTDRVLERIISYEVDARDINKPIATVTLKYRNTADKITWRYIHYRSYTRVLVPYQSHLILAQGMMKNDNFKGLEIPSDELDIDNELNKTIFGAFWIVLLAHTKELKMKYQLPQSVVNDLKKGIYRLYWQKQPGIENTIIDFKIRLPRSIKYIKNNLNNNSNIKSIYQYKGVLNQDKQFELYF